MTRRKIDYGIDLGTTNSAIARIDNGEVKIIKSHDGQMDTTPSVVHFTKVKTMFVGSKAFNQIDADAKKNFKEFQSKKSIDGANTCFEFKRTMGSDKKYFVPNMEKDYFSEDLSSEILKKLKSYVIDEEVSAAVITVPAKFRQNQLDATQRCAELAGFEYCELLQEPIAASIAYGIDSKNMKGYWLVFDFGGGTFDAALMKVDDGIMKVIDTEGDNHLGGKNIDYALVDQLLISYLYQNFSIKQILADDQAHFLLKDELKKHAEEAKIELSQNKEAPIFVDDIGIDDNGKEMYIDININLSQFEKVVSPIFQRAIDISLKLLNRNKLKGIDLDNIILIGGPTFSQTLRRMLREQITERFETSIDPMTAVAKGAALFAATKDIPTTIIKRDNQKIQLILKYPETTVETEEKIGLRIDRKLSSGIIPAKLYVEITRNDKVWSTGKIELEGDSEIFNLMLNESKSNGFLISLFDEKGTLLPCEPSGFTIIQGIKVASATLPYNIGIDLFDPGEGRIGVYTLKGLEKNTSLPAKGKGTYKTQKEIRPGNSEDQIKIEIYEIGYKQDGSKKILNELINTITITGEDLPQYLPAKSDVEITLNIDSSRRIRFSAYFPYLDETIDIDVPEQRQVEFEAEKISQELEETKHLIKTIEEESLVVDYKELKQLENEIVELDAILKNGKGDYNTKTQVMERLREVLKKLDHIQEENEWPKIEDELQWLLNRMKNNVERYGDSKTKKESENFETQAKIIIKQANIKLAKDLMEEIRSFNFTLVRNDIGFWISYIKDFDANFAKYNWTNPKEARNLIEEATQVISNNPTKEKLEAIVRELFGLIPETEKATILENDESTLMR